MARKRSIIHRNRLLMGLVVLFLIYIGAIFVRQEVSIRQLKAEEIQVKAQLSSLNEEIQLLQEDLEASQSLSYVEKIAREKLKMVKPDEVVYVLKEAVPAAQQSDKE